MGNLEIHKEKHEFALCVESLSLLLQKKNSGNSVIFSDDTLFHRMVTVLRLQVGDTCVFFDRDVFIKALITTFVGKKQVHVTIQSIQPTIVLYPKITFLLPLLKRDDLESALYALTEVGVNTIQLISTQKSGAQWSQQRDNERIARIVIAAAEQSKNFAYPHVKAPISLQAALKEYNDGGDTTTKIFFDPEGRKIFDVMQVLHGAQPKHILLLVGPEGDLNLEEKKLVQVNNFTFCALTPTIMRATQAAAFAAGFVRSLLVSALL
jgi:16S rRNA (uracil1498-N3)-methyltransferase